MKKSDGIVLGAIALGFLFLLKPKVNPVFAESAPVGRVYTADEYDNPFEKYVQQTSSNNATNYKTTGAGTYIAVLDN